MDNAVAALTTTVSQDALWGVFADSIPVVGVVVLFAFGFYLIRRMLKGVSRSKAKI